MGRFINMSPQQNPYRKGIIDGKPSLYVSRKLKPLSNFGLERNKFKSMPENILKLDVT
jgi:hypothetical protein